MHHCARCGTDLTRRRALRDPIYSLPLVTCPSCGLTVARRKHPLPVWTRRVIRAVPVFLGLSAQIVLIPIVTLGFVRMAAVLADEIMLVGWSRDGTMNRDVLAAFSDRYLDHPEDLAGFIGMACIAGLAGVWIGLLMRHWKRGPLLASWLALVLAYVALDVFRARSPALAWFFAPMLGEPWAKTPLHGAVWTFVILASLPVTLLAAAVGNAAGRGLERRRSTRRRKMLARLRKERSHRQGRSL